MRILDPISRQILRAPSLRPGLRSAGRPSRGRAQRALTSDRSRRSLAATPATAIWVRLPIHASRDCGAAATSTPQARARSRGSGESAYSDAMCGARLLAHAHAAARQPDSVDRCAALPLALAGDRMGKQQHLHLTLPSSPARRVRPVGQERKYRRADCVVRRMRDESLHAGGGDQPARRGDARRSAVRRRQNANSVSPPTPPPRPQRDRRRRRQAARRAGRRARLTGSASSQ